MKRIKINVDLEFYVEDNTQFVALDKTGVLVQSSVPMKRGKNGEWEASTRRNILDDDLIYEIHEIINWKKTLREI